MMNTPKVWFLMTRLALPSMLFMIASFELFLGESYPLRAFSIFYGQLSWTFMLLFYWIIFGMVIAISKSLPFSWRKQCGYVFLLVVDCLMGLSLWLLLSDAFEFGGYPRQAIWIAVAIVFFFLIFSRRSKATEGLVSI